MPMNADEFRQLFSLLEGPVDAGELLRRPQAGEVELAREVVAEMPLGAILRDLGAVAARQVGDVLLAVNVRPANSSVDATMHRDLAVRIGKALLSGSGPFDEAMAEFLGNRG